jgi:hypothetical protein
MRPILIACLLSAAAAAGWYQACHVDKDICGETEADK